MRLIVALLLMPTLGFAGGADIPVILKKVDELYRSQSSHAVIEMEVVTPNWHRTMKMEAWTKTLDYTFITIKEPRKDRGVSSLKRGSEMWNYFPKINKVIKIPASMMMGSWMGSDFTNDDLVKDESYVDDYDSSLGVAAQEDRYLIISKPKKNHVSLWGKIETIVEKSSLLPIQQIFYDEKGEKIRLMNFKDVKVIGGKTMPTVMELIPLSKKGHKTVIRYTEVQFNIPIDDQIFTRTHLEKRR